MKPMQILPFVVITAACNGGEKADEDTDTSGPEYSDLDTDTATTSDSYYYSGNAGWYDYSDDDGDGVVADHDCEPNDAGIFPGNVEDCDNGIDDDCDGLIDGDRERLNEDGEACNGLDDDGDGQYDEYYPDLYAGVYDGMPDCWLEECGTEVTGTTTTYDTGVFLDTAMTPPADTSADTGVPPVPADRHGGIDWGWAEPVRAQSTHWLRRAMPWVTP